MPNYSLELELFSVLNASTSDFEIWTDGTQLGGGYTVSSSGTTITIASISYGGSLPTSLEFRFDDAAPGSVDQIEIRAVIINDRYVNTNNYLSTSTLNDTGTSTVNLTGTEYIFNNSAEPALSEFTTGATRTLTAGVDTVRVFMGSTQEIFDALAGRDIIFLGSGDDKIFGNDGDDYIRAGAGADLISGGDDNDRIYGQDGNDELYGGNGNDRLHGGNDDDELHGGAGNDRLNGNSGNDILTGGDDDDTLGGGSGDDYLYGDAGNDILSGGSGADTLDGGTGNDLAYGGSGIDHIDGDDGDDRLMGDVGNDVINGGAGQDEIFGGTDDDSLYGGAGNDEIYGGTGNDTIEGGADIDNLYGGDNDDTIDGGTGDDQLVGGSGDDTLNGGDGDDQLSGDLAVYEYSSGLLVIEAENYLTNTTKAGHEWEVVTDAAASGGKAMYIDNNGGNNINTTTASVYANSPELTYNVNFAATGTYYAWLRGYGPSGSDDSAHIGFNGVRQTDDGGVTGFTGGGYRWGNSSTYGGTVVTFNVTSTGENTINLWMREDGFYADKILITNSAAYTPTGLGPLENEQNSSVGGADTINGGAGDDVIQGDIGDDILSGGDDNDTIFGGADNDTLNGDAGDDTLNSGSGDNTLNGGADNDTLNGGTGNNILNGDAGDDTLNSGSTLGSSGTSDTNVSATADEGEEIIATGNMESLTSSDTELGRESSGVQLTGMRWQNLNIDQGAVISRAYIEFDADESDSGAITLTFHGQDIDSAAAFTTTNSDVSNRTQTTASVDWHNVESWTAGNLYQTPDISVIIQEIVDRGGWTSGTSDLVIIAERTVGTGTAARVAESFNGDGVAPRLVVEFVENKTELNGGTGNDDLYGSTGMDIFGFSDVGAANVDTVYNFTSGVDQLDLSDLLTGYDPTTDLITDYIQITDSGGNSDVRVDTTGSGSFGAGTVVAVIDGVTGLTDEVDLVKTADILV